ncbi:MAG: gliding motility-associated C-terminal domain-containing protein [Bacteroidetes bacterium]|nr:gliding motility-associated C-terminal domain-containing protein [Bacteroidota bacterium]
MQRPILTALFILLLLPGFSQQGNRSVNAIDFLIPDTVCVNEPFTITNLSHGSASTFYWSFCTGNTNNTPFGFPMISVPSFYNQPAYASLINDDGEIYSFITNGNGTIIRNQHHHNMMIPPATSLPLGNSFSINNNIKGLQIKKDNGNWYGFVANGSQITRLDFGASLMTNPSFHLYIGIFDTTDLLNGLVILKDGSDWIGFYTNLVGNSITRLSWGSNLASQPVPATLGNIGNMNVPWQLAVMKKDSSWYILVANEGDNSITRLSFGTSLMNNPTGTNLGNVGALDHDQGIVLIRDCEALNGFVLNHSPSNDVLVRLHFPGDISGPVTGQSLGNIGSLNQPSTFSELIRVGDTLYTIATNPGNSTISLFYFPGCTNSSIPSSTLPDPPPISYSATGQYNIMLVTDEGLPTQQNVCKPIVAMPAISVNIGNDTIVCSGKMMTLDAGSGFHHYLWSNGDTTETIQTEKPGRYWVTVTNRWNCEASDTLTITQQTAVTSSVDTAICYGKKYYAGGAFQSTPGTYVDTLQTTAGCDSVRTTHLTVKPRIPVDLGSTRSICPGESIKLDATLAGATYSWQDSSTDSVFTVTDPGTYWVMVTYDKCTTGDTVLITECPAELWFPSAFTPNGDGVNDLFRPKGISISNFHMTIFNRWGQMLYETDNMERGWDGTAKGILCPPDTYTFVTTYEGTDNPGSKKKMQGSFILLR